MLVNFVGRKDKRELYFEVALNDQLASQMQQKKSEDREDPGVLKRIILDAFQHIKDVSKDVQIQVTSIEGDSVKYTIEQEENHPVHNIALSTFNMKEAIDGIVEHKIVTIGQLIQDAGVESILEHFSAIEVEPPSLFAQMKALTGHFFSWFLRPFRVVEFLWEAISHKSEKAQAHLRWDLDLMAATCGVAPNREISVTESLCYMAAMMEREADQARDPVLTKRVTDGAKLGQKMDELRGNFKLGKFKKLCNQVKNATTSLKEGQKMLIPVSYIQEEKTVQMLMEIGREERGTFAVALISSSEETRALFDREHGLKTSQSPRREIEKVKENDLLAMLSTLLELDTAPQCRASTSDWQSIFMQALKLPKTTVKAGDMTNPYVSGLSPSHVGETLAYLAKQQKTPQEAKRFELAARLRIFLDVTSKDGKSLKDPRYWRLVRTSAYQLARMIEDNKQIIGISQARATEMTRIYHEINQMLDKLDTNLPELVNLRTQIAPHLTGYAKVSPEPAPPPLQRLKVKPNVYPQVDPPFTPLDASDPFNSIADWGKRCQALIDAGEWDLASREAKLMVRMLPDPPAFLSAITAGQAPTVLDALNAMSEAVARASSGDDHPSLYTIASLEMLNHYAIALMQRDPRYAKLKVPVSINLSATRLIEEDQRWITNVMESVPLNKEGTNLTEFIKTSKKEDLAILQSVHDMSQRTTQLMGRLPSDIPLAFRPPEYAKDVAHEITNRYTSEYCCLGCIRDNCPNYNKIPQQDMRFHPLFMLHNYVDVFCQQLVQRGNLHRDEVADLLYTQQTNQNANTVWENCHNEEHATQAATGFNAEDRRIQVMNTMAIFLDHPHFFKQPDLCWQFETRLFAEGAFKEMLRNQQIAMEYKPFLMSSLRKLNREISVSYAAGDREVAGYLLHVSNRIADLIMNQEHLSPDLQNELSGLLTADTDDLLLKWGTELIGKTDEKAQLHMRMILPLLMNRYHSRLLKNSADPCFKDKGVLSKLLMAAEQIESLGKGKEKIDPEAYDRYQALMSWLLPQAKEIIDTEPTKGDFVNSILTVMHPEVAAMRLEWDPMDMPTVLAIDPETHDYYEYDLTTGQLTFEKKRRQEIPENLRQDLDLQRLFGATLDSGWDVRKTLPAYDGPHMREYTHPDFPGYRIFVKRRGEEKGRIVIERTITTPSGKKEWMSYKRFQEQDQVVQEKKRSPLPDIVSEAAQLIGDRQCWVDRSGKKMYVLDPDTSETYAILELEDRQIKDIHLVQQDIHVLSPDPLAMERFSLLEDPKFIIASGHKSHPDTVQFSRYQLASSEAPLIYDIGKEKITASAFPGYELAPYGARAGSRDPSFGVSPLPPAFDVYHLLQKEGDERVLIPFCQFEQEINLDGDPLRSTHAVFTEDYGKIPVYEFKVDPDSNRLIAQSGDAYAYLAYLSMAHWDYASAAHYLDKAKTSAGYNENYDQIFRWLEDWTDDSPNGVALRLRFELLRENVADERTVQAIAAGKRAKAEDVQLGKTGRLETLADLYAKYCAHTDTQRPGEESRSPELDLSSEQRFDVARYVRRLIVERGDQLTETGEPRPIRPYMAPLQQYMQRDSQHETLGIRQSALGVWLFKGAEKHKSPFTVQDPRWVLRDFRDVFNKILDGDPDSIEYKHLVNQLRMLSEYRAEGMDPIEQKQVQNAQSYLLKLASAQVDDPGFITDIQQTTLKESNDHLGDLKGPWFLRTRSSRLKLLNAMTSPEGFDSYCLVSKQRAIGKANTIIADEERNRSQRSVAKRALKFLENPKVPNQGRDFENAFRTFLLQETLGNGAAQSVQTLDTLFSYLDGLDIIQPRQLLEPLKPKPKVVPPTYREKYEPLLTKFGDLVKRSDLEMLEKEVAGREEPKLTEKIITPETDKVAILHDFLAEYEEKFGPIPKESVAVSETIFDRLASAEEEAFQRVAEEYRADLHAYLEATGAVEPKREDAETLHQMLEENVAGAKKEREQLRRSLLQYVEKFDTPAGTLALRRLVGAEVKPSLDVLIAIWRRNEIDIDWESSPLKALGLQQMTPEVLNNLDEKITTYLQLDAELHHLERTVDASTAYLNSCGESPHDIGEGQLAQELWERLHTQRHFALGDADARDMLYLEYSLGLVLRPQQVETLRDMLSEPNAVRQLIMGGGKSKVLLPMLAKRKATGKNLVMLMLPDELYETNCRDLDTTNRLLFGQEMHRFNFFRKSDRSEEALLKTYEMLLKTVKDSGFVMTTKSSMLSFKNAYVELLYKLQGLPEDSPDRAQLIGQVRVMSKILKLFKEHTDVIADEVDACLDVRKEMNFSLGDADPVDQVKVEVGMELMSLILQAKQGEPLHELREAVIKNTQAAIAPDRRKELLKHLVTSFREKHTEQLAKFTQQQFTDYIMDATKETAVRDWVLGLEDSDAEEDVALFHQITTLKAFIDRGFGTTFNRVGNVNYGRDPISGIWTIPYKASTVPSIGSEFEDDIERIAFTYQDYLQKGVEYQQVYQSIARMLKRGVDELRAAESDKFFNINDTQGGKEFEDFLRQADPQGKLGSLALSAAAHPKRIEAIVAAINATPEGRLGFCHTQVASKMQQYGAQINSNSQDLVEMVHSFGGFAGTLWNLHTYHDKIKAEKSQGVDGKTWALMLGRDVPVHTFAFDADKPIDSIVDGLSVIDNYQAVVDTGAYLRGIDNHEFIDACMQKAEQKGVKIGGGIYFDKAGKIVKKGGVEEKPQTIETAPETDKMTNLTLYDQSHTIGADIKQGKKAKAVVTIGENTFVRDIFQAVWRLRQLDQEQRVELALSEAIRARILKDKTEGDLTTITSEDIFQFCLQNEVSREAEDNFRAEKEKIQGTAKRHGFTEIVNIAAGDVSDEMLVTMAQQMAKPEAELFIKQRPREEAYREYGQLKVKEDPENIFVRMRHLAQLKCNELATRLQDISQEASQRSLQMGEKVAKRASPPSNWSPNKVDSSISTAGGEVEQEAQAETENTLELMLETETLQDTEIPTEIIIPMVESGEAGHGDVVSLPMEIIRRIIDTGESKSILWPHGKRVGDKVEGDEMLPVHGLARKLSGAVPFFDPGIFLSSVFERNLPASADSAVAPQSIFYSNRKPVKDILITKKNDRWTMIIPTVHEAHRRCREYINDTNLPAVVVGISLTRPMILYKNGQNRSDTLPFPDNDIPHFYRLYVQAKLFNGEITFETEEEQSALKAWLKEVGVRQFANYFQNHILSAKPRRFADAYPTSSLFKIIQEVEQGA